MPEFIAEQYARAKIALLTGWTYEYIDGLGALDQESILQVYGAEQALMRQKNNGVRSR